MRTLAAELPLTSQTPYKVRVLIRRRFAEILPATTLWDLLTVVTELITNAIRHGDGATVRVKLGVTDDGEVCGEVENDGYGVVEPRPIDITTTSGLGLHIVDALASRWRAYVGGSTRVRFELLEP
jgi:signal transduction histidine kinase